MAFSRLLPPFMPLAAALLSACSDPPPSATAEQAAATAPFPTAAVELAPVARETAFDGVVEATNQSTVSAQTGGRVVELPYDVGDHVEKGAVIVRITTTEQQARTRAAEAALAEAHARLAEAQLVHDRTRDVYERKLVAKAQLDKAAADLDAAAARAKAAQEALTEAREGLGYTTIRAPYGGIVVSRQVQLGETVTPGRPLMTGVSLDHLRVAVDIPQQHIGPLRKHRKARAILPDGRSAAIGELRIPPAADPATHSFRVLADLPRLDADAGVFPGTLVKIAFVSGESQGLLVPPEAVVHRGEVTALYVVDDRARVAFRAVRAGSPGADGRIPVLAGLAAGERVALDPVAAAAHYKKQGGAE
ncbi:MAG: efflux RND transporter periplasmic adaptor subunit [Gammaproteobacteria bacterium]|nr:efflux RND transporter periplasmic adaptor subunit [Gammaproteobacteria bacterium]